MVDNYVGTLEDSSLLGHFYFVCVHCKGWANFPFERMPRLAIVQYVVDIVG